MFRCTITVQYNIQNQFVLYIHVHVQYSVYCIIYFIYLVCTVHTYSILYNNKNIKIVHTVLAFQEHFSFLITLYSILKLIKNVLYIIILYITLYTVILLISSNIF